MQYNLSRSTVIHDRHYSGVWFSSRASHVRDARLIEQQSTSLVCRDLRRRNFHDRCVSGLAHPLGPDAPAQGRHQLVADGHDAPPGQAARRDLSHTGEGCVAGEVPEQPAGAPAVRLPAGSGSAGGEQGEVPPGQRRSYRALSQPGRGLDAL